MLAATYAISGSFDEHSISVNPLAAVTPGFLGGLFDSSNYGEANGSDQLPQPSGFWRKFFGWLLLGI